MQILFRAPPGRAPLLRALIPLVALLAAPAVAQRSTAGAPADTAVAAVQPESSGRSNPALVAAKRGFSDTDARPTSVNAFQVYLACQHRDAIRQTVQQQSPEAARLNAFCRRGLPGRNEWLSAEQVNDWLSSVPTVEEIHDYAREVEASRQEAVALLSTAFGKVEGNAESYGLIQFAPGDAVLDPGDVAQVEALRKLLSDTVARGPAIGVRVRGYPDAAGGPLALERARAVAALLAAADTVLGRPGKLEAFAWPSDSATVYPPDGLWGRVTVHLVYPPRAAPELASLGDIRFPQDGKDLDREDYEVLAEVVQSILATDSMRGYPIVVTGFANGQQNDANLRVARARAQSIRHALAVLLAPHGYTEEDIVIRAEVRQLPASASAARIDSTRSVVIGLGSLPGDAPTVQGSSGQAASARIPLSVEGVASAAASVLVERAERQVQGYVFQFVADEVCNGYHALVPQTCIALDGFSEADNRYQLGLANLQQLVRSDFAGLPSVLLGQALASRYGAELRVLRVLAEHQAAEDARVALDGQAAEDAEAAARRALQRRLSNLPILADTTIAGVQTLAQSIVRDYPTLKDRVLNVQRQGGAALVMAYGIEFVRRVGSGENGLDAVREFNPWLERLVRQMPMLAYLRESEPVDRVRRFAQFLTDVDSAGTRLRREVPQGVSAETVYLYAARTALVNARPAERKAVGASLAFVVQTRRQFERASFVIDSLRALLPALTGSAEQAVQARRDFYAAALGELAASYYTLTIDAPLVPAMRDSVARIATPVRNVLYALQTGDLRAAFAQTVALLPRVLPPVQASECVDDRVQGCSRLGLSPQWFRVAALATDVSQAENGEELRDGMRRFVEQGTDVRTKRTGPPRTRIFVNGYVTGSAEAAFDDHDNAGLSVQVPLGLELVRRLGVGKPGWTYGGFLRLVELGGFLPSENQEGDRSTDDLLSSLIRPGLFLVVGAPEGFPATFGVGLTTSLWRVPGDVQAQQDDAAEWEWRSRFSAFLGWDIPIFP